MLGLHAKDGQQQNNTELPDQTRNRTKNEDEITFYNGGTSFIFGIRAKNKLK